MRTKNIFIITEAGKGIGLGHLSRCTAIYQAFKDKGMLPRMIINGSKDMIKNRSYQVFNWAKQNQKLFNIIKDADIAILDSYLAPKSFYEKLSKIVKLPVYIDDYNRINYPKGIVISGSASTDDFDHILLRKEFWQSPAKRIRKKVRTIMVTFGASYDGDITRKIIKSLSCTYPNILKNVVINSPSKYEKVKDKSVRSINGASSKLMKKLMLESDIAISACGQTLYELASTGTPTVAVAISKDQYQNLKSWKRFASFASIDSTKSLNPVPKILKAVNIFMSYDERLKFYKKAKIAIDGKGAGRVVEMMLQELEKTHTITMRDAKKCDCHNIWAWRNHAVARRWSLSSGRIPYEDHKDWFAKKINDINCKIFIAENKQNQSIGQVRFDSNDKEAVISVNLNPKYYAQGFGNKVISSGTNRFLSLSPEIEEITAEIDASNIASKKAFKKAGYVSMKKQIRSGRKTDIYKFRVEK